MAVRQTNRHASWKKFSAAFSDALGDVGEQLTAAGKRILTDACEEWLEQTDAEWPQHSEKPNGARYGGDAMHPWYLGHLHDSIAVRIAEKNRTVAIRYMPQKASSEPQHTSVGDGTVHDRIIGAEWAVSEARNAQYVFLPGIQMQLIVGVPYARKVDESGRHSGYLDELQAQFFSHIEDRCEIAMEPVFRSRIFKPNKK